MCTSEKKFVSKSNVLKKDDRFLRGRHIAYTIYDQIRATGASVCSKWNEGLCMIQKQIEDGTNKEKTFDSPNPTENYLE